MNSEFDEIESEIFNLVSKNNTLSSSSSEAAIEVQPNISQPTKNSLGGFLESEEQFHVFTTFLSQTDNLPSSSGEAAIDSGGNDLPPPLFTYPSFGSLDEWLLRYNSSSYAGKAATESGGDDLTLLSIKDNPSSSSGEEAIKVSQPNISQQINSEFDENSFFEFLESEEKLIYEATINSLGGFFESEEQFHNQIIYEATKNSLGGFPESEEQFHNQIIYEPKNYVGGFREEEFDGKPFHIFTTFLSQTNNPSSSSGEAAIDSGGDDLPPPLFICPYTSISSDEQYLRRRDDPNGKEYLPVDVSPHFFDKRRGDEQFQYMIGSKIYRHKYNLPSSSGEAAIDSGGVDLPPPLFICPSFLWSVQWCERRCHDPTGYLPVEVYPHFFDKRRGDEQFQYMIGSEIYHHPLAQFQDMVGSKIRYSPCKLPLVPLFWCNNNKEPHHDEFHCDVCKESKLGTDYYKCVDSCGGKFHKECIECPLEIKHPSFPFTSLKLYSPPPFSPLRCCCCQECIGHLIYYCPTYKLILHTVCAMKPIPILIDNPKRHPHPLTFFPKQNFLACNVCGLIKEHFPSYVCARCVFVVHQVCVYHPYVIIISRHHHRISFTYSLPSGEFSCGVCRRNVNNNYGAYSCNKCEDYVVHTKCALREDLWNGQELEGIPEVPETVVQPPFERISDGIILHFTHGHHLKLEMSKFYDESKFCRACVLPIYEGSYYSCMDECDFILHKACANAPRRKHHPLHAHPLTLKVVTNEYNNKVGYFFCKACRRKSCGFAYADWEGSFLAFRLDLRCASVSEPFKYEGHEHPLFLALTPEEEESATCQICQEEGDRDNECKKLTCIDCKYIICFACATLPYKAMYKHDKHLLTFQKKEEASVDHSGWCDRCEGKIVYSKKGGFYSCDDYCSTTLHVDCLLGGEDMYMKPGQTIYLTPSLDVDILENKTMTRPFCHRKDRSPHQNIFYEPSQTIMTQPFCHGKEYRCPRKVVFKRGNMTFCSLYCLSGLN